MQADHAQFARNSGTQPRDNSRTSGGQLADVRAPISNATDISCATGGATQRDGAFRKSRHAEWTAEALPESLCAGSQSGPVMRAPRDLTAQPNANDRRPGDPR